MPCTTVVSARLNPNNMILLFFPFNHLRKGRFQGKDGKVRELDKGGGIRIWFLSFSFKPPAYRAVPGGAWARLAGVRRDEVYLLYIELPAHPKRNAAHARLEPPLKKKEGFGISRSPQLFKLHLLPYEAVDH